MHKVFAVLFVIPRPLHVLWFMQLQKRYFSKEISIVTRFGLLSNMADTKLVPSLPAFRDVNANAGE